MKKLNNPGMKRSRTPWSTKLRPEMTHAVATDPKGRGKMLLPTPLLVAEEILAVPSGELRTVPELRLRLARRFDADFTCPLMTGIFFNIIAGAAEEQLAAGEPPLAPYWRVVLADGTLSPKTPAGPEKQAEHLRQEGHLVGLRGTKLQVSGFARQSGI
jgi:6-O-methylguanine DNA methyltransferase, DNA binding domain